mgnify:CR=1 FL=1
MSSAEPQIGDVRINHGGVKIYPNTLRKGLMPEPNSPVVLLIIEGSSYNHEKERGTETKPIGGTRV